jgi:hypothetical protein
MARIGGAPRSIETTGRTRTTRRFSRWPWLGGGGSESTVPWRGCAEALGGSQQRRKKRRRENRVAAAGGKKRGGRLGFAVHQIKEGAGGGGACGGRGGGAVTSAEGSRPYREGEDDREEKKRGRRGTRARPKGKRREEKWAAAWAGAVERKNKKICQGERGPRLG